MPSRSGFIMELQPILEKVDFKSALAPSSASYQRKRESSPNSFWIPAFAGMMRLQRIFNVQKKMHPLTLIYFQSDNTFN